MVAELSGGAALHQPSRSRQVISFWDDPGVVSTDVHDSGVINR